MKKIIIMIMCLFALNTNNSVFASTNENIEMNNDTVSEFINQYLAENMEKVILLLEKIKKN